jgi:hypothetical protein
MSVNSDEEETIDKELMEYWKHKRMSDKELMEYWKAVQAKTGIARGPQGCLRNSARVFTTKWTTTRTLE